MFILRSYQKDEPMCSQYNQFIGESYTLIDKQINNKDFEDSFTHFWKIGSKDEQPFPHDYYDETFAFLSTTCNGKPDLVPLYKKFVYYVMTESGKTFTKIEFK